MTPFKWQRLQRCCRNIVKRNGTQSLCPACCLAKSCGHVCISCLIVSVPQEQGRHAPQGVMWARRWRVTHLLTLVPTRTSLYSLALAGCSTPVRARPCPNQDGHTTLTSLLPCTGYHPRDHRWSDAKLLTQLLASPGVGYSSQQLTVDDRKRLPLIWPHIQKPLNKIH